MDTLVFRAVVLYVEVCFVLSQSQGNHVFQPIIRNVSMTEPFKRLKLEWDVHGDSKAYAPETKLIFNIQVNQTEENRIVLDTNYSVVLREINQSLVWSWDPFVPLQCDPHVVRIRSLVVDKNIPRSETWTNWSPWEGVTVPHPKDGNNIFPENQTVKEGSNVTMCCTADKTDTLTGYKAFKTVTEINTMDRKFYFNLKNVSQDDPNVICRMSPNGPRGTALNVIDVPKKPRDFTCKMEEKMLTCSWKAEKINPAHKMCKTQLFLTDLSSGKTYCESDLKEVEENSCSFTTEHIPDLRLRAENCFGYNDTEYHKENPPTETKNLIVILLLGIIAGLLFICICFCSICCIRHHSFPRIPKPEVSPFLKRNPGTMEVSDVDPDKLEVMDNHQTCTGKQYSLGMLVIENIAYFDPAYNPTPQEREAKSKNLNPTSTSYKPLQDLFAVSPPSSSYKPLQDLFVVSPPSTSYKPLQDFFENEPIVQPQSKDGGNFSYTSGMEIPSCVAQLGDLPGLDQHMQSAAYKPQPVTEFEIISPHPGDYIHLRNTFS